MGDNSQNCTQSAIRPLKHYPIFPDNYKKVLDNYAVKIGRAGRTKSARRFCLQARYIYIRRTLTSRNTSSRLEYSIHLQASAEVDGKLLDIKEAIPLAIEYIFPITVLRHIEHRVIVLRLRECSWEALGLRWLGYNGTKLTINEFANAFISSTCVLNGRKVMTWILQRLKMMKI